MISIINRGKWEKKQTNNEGLYHVILERAIFAIYSQQRPV
jgi:hypothetical protein